MYSERKGVKDDSKIFGLSYYRAGAAINLAGEICVEEILRGKIRSLVLDMLSLGCLPDIQVEM